MLFKTISKSNQAEIVEKSSKFIAFAYSIQSTEELKTKLEELKKIHPKSRHICYAYRLGFDQNNYRMVDDGEPSGTAGKPILGQIDKFQFTNIVVFVVRYFGGILLGAGGLIKAYKSAAQLCLEKCEQLEINPKSLYSISCSYQNAQSFINQLKTIEGRLIETKPSDTHELNVIIEISQKNISDYFQICKTKIEKSNANDNFMQIFGCEIKELDQIG